VTGDLRRSAARDSNRHPDLPQPVRLRRASYSRNPRLSIRRVPLELVSLIVDDHDPAIRFFTDSLGFVLSEDVGSTTSDGRSKRWVVVRPVEGGAGLVLARADGEEQSGVIGRQFAGRVGLFLRVDDFDGTLVRIGRAGCELVRPVRDEAYGRVCVFKDPWGNLWDLLGDRAGQDQDLPETDSPHGAA